MSAILSDRPTTPLLDLAATPEALRRLKPEQLRQLADELRQEMISAVGTTGGHLGSGLGVVELTVALHYVFDTPTDTLIWDVGHQAYPHKILTGRRDRIRTLRQGGGLSGFTKRSESEYDPFGAAHSSTSISAALGFAMANKMQGKAGRGIAVVSSTTPSPEPRWPPVTPTAEITSARSSSASWRNSASESAFISDGKCTRSRMVEDAAMGRLLGSGAACGVRPVLIW